MTEHPANVRNRAVVRILIGTLLAMLAIYSVANLQPTGDAATLASLVFEFLIAVLSLYLMGSGIKSVPSSGACSSDMVADDPPPKHGLTLMPAGILSSQTGVNSRRSGNSRD